MKFEEYVRHDATGLAELVAKKEVSASELLETAIARTEAVNPKINAVITKLYDQGREMLKKAPENAPFAGVPFLLKDLEIEWAGTPLKSGCRGFKNYVSTDDSEIVKRFKKTGVVFFGKTNTPEFGLTPFTEPETEGPTRNPWNLAHTSGGSSGGSGAAVAAGIVPMASASDGGGSIRIPASNNGLVGLKTSRGRISLGPRFTELWSGAVVSFVVSRSVRDSAAMLDAIHGPSPGDPYFMPAPAISFTESIKTPPKKLKIAFNTDHVYPHLKVDDECKKAVTHTLQLLEDLGHSIEEVKLPYTPEFFTKVFVPMVVGETASAIRQLSTYLGRKATKEDMEMNTWFLSRLGESYTAGEFAFAKLGWAELSRKMGEMHLKYDVFVQPTLARPPIRVGELQNSKQENTLLKIVSSLGLIGKLKGGKVIDDLAEKTFGYIPHTPVANVTGQPSLSLPMHWTPQNLPVGVMFTAALGDEALLLQLAAQIEQAKPWFHRLPTID
ncbi:MAG: amidase [Runella sp.]